MELIGAIDTASNLTFMVELTADNRQHKGVYKPVAGEQPLWDFATGSLAEREFAAYVVSEALGWNVVPPTALRSGPHGVGMVQLWCEPTATQPAVVATTADEFPAQYVPVTQTLNRFGQLLVLGHEPSTRLREIALFDIVVNNTDRKGGHVLSMADGNHRGIDHGICFHEDDKLRTVLWGFMEQELSPAEISRLTALKDWLTTPSAQVLDELLTPTEIRALGQRLERLLQSRRFPRPDGNWPALPWPVF